MEGDTKCLDCNCQLGEASTTQRERHGARCEISRADRPPEKKNGKETAGAPDGTRCAEGCIPFAMVGGTSEMEVRNLHDHETTNRRRIKGRTRAETGSRKEEGHEQARVSTAFVDENRCDLALPSPNTHANPVTGVQTHSLTPPFPTPHSLTSHTHHHAHTTPTMSFVVVHFDPRQSNLVVLSHTYRHADDASH